MKKLSLFMALFAITALNGRNDCLSSSMHLKQKFDTKAEHPAGCSCPCEQYPQSGRNKCMQCQHTHHAGRYEVIDSQTQGNQESARIMAQYVALPQLLNNIIKKHQNNQ